MNHSGKKPHPQKGTGRARQGYLGAPQYKGGGRVHAPKPKFDQHVRINKKERRAAIRHLIIEKILDNRLHVLQFEQLKEPKPKSMVEFLKNSALEGKKVLFLGEGMIMGAKEGNESPSPAQKFETFVKSINNIPGSEFMLFPTINGFDVIVSHELVVMESALDQLKVLLGGQK